MTRDAHRRLPVALVALALTSTLAAEVNAQGATQAAADVAAPHAPATYYGAVQSALERNCVTCHSETRASLGGMTAPFALTTYEDARRYARSIARAVESDYMPPWDADIQHAGMFNNERYLSDEDKQTLIEWADAGAPMGDPSEAASFVSSQDVVRVQEPTVDAEGRIWLNGEPDMVIGFEEPVLVCAAVDDWQPNLPQRVLSGEISEPRWIRATEYNTSSIVHHTVSSVLGVGTPGRGPVVYPDGWGILMLPGQHMSISMHYHKEIGKEYLDDTRGAIQFYDDGAVIDYVVETDLQPYQDFVIPAGDPYYMVQNTTHFDEDIYLLSMGPHAHYRGRAVRVELQRPDRQFRETLLWVPDYDFNWQFQYELKEPYLVPAGSSMITTWYYDNSEANPYNPDPTVDVVYGPATTDEMMNSRIYYARAKPLGLRVGDPIPQEIIDRARAADERAARTAQDWESASGNCVQTPARGPAPRGVASR
jgi:mono/diheme cytochrome c family protein